MYERLKKTCTKLTKMTNNKDGKKYKNCQNKTFHVQKMLSPGGGEATRAVDICTLDSLESFRRVLMSGNWVNSR